MACRSSGNGDRWEAGLCEQATQCLRDAASADDRRPLARGHLIAANVRVNQPDTADDTSLLTLRSVSAPYSLTSPVTAGTSR